MSGSAAAVPDWLTTDVLANIQGRWASSAMFLYEILITMDQEVEYVWTGTWTLPKVLYLLSRYGGLAFNFFVAIVTQTDHNNAFCDVFNPLQYFLFVFISSTSDLLLLLRVSALYSGSGSILGVRDRVVRSFLFGFFVVILMTDIGLFIWDFTEADPGSLPPAGDNFGCLGRSGAPFFVYCIAVIFVLTLNVLMFTLTMIKLLPNWRRLHLMTMASLQEVVIRDGTIYFALVVASTAILTTMIFALDGRAGIETAALPWCSVVIPIAACRLYLNLRAQGQFPQPQSTTGTTTFGSILKAYQVRFGRRVAVSDSWDTTFELERIRSPA